MSSGHSETRHLIITDFMKKQILILASTLLLASCMEFGPLAGDYDNPEPEKIYAEADLGDIPRKTIAEVKAMYDGGPVTFTEDFYIKGQVTTSDREGNFYRGFYIQDETSGIEIKVGKTGLYNFYKPAQWIYVLCKGLTIGDYEGAKQIGKEDITGEYESTYIDIQMLIDRHVLKGEIGEPVDTLDLTGKQIYEGSKVKEEYIGKLVKIDGLTYANGIFCLMYVDPNLNHKLQSNRVFLDEGFKWESGPAAGAVTLDNKPVNRNWNVYTWGMTKARCETLLESGAFDSANIGNDDDALLGVADADGVINRTKVKPSAYSVSQYFRLNNESTKKYLAIRSSGYAKFADTAIPDRVLGMSGGVIPSSGSTERITVVGVFGVYREDPQLTLIDMAGVYKSDGKTPWYKSDGSVNE